MIKNKKLLKINLSELHELNLRVAFDCDYDFGYEFPQKFINYTKMCELLREKKKIALRKVLYDDIDSGNEGECENLIKDLVNCSSLSFARLVRALRKNILNKRKID